MWYFTLFRGLVHEKKQKKKDKNKKEKLADLEKSILRETSSQSDAEVLYDAEEEIDRKAYEKRRVIHELTPKERDRKEMDDDLQLARSVILEEGIDKEHEKTVAAKRKEAIRRTSTDACKVTAWKPWSFSRGLNCILSVEISFHLFLEYIYEWLSSISWEHFDLISICRTSD